MKSVFKRWVAVLAVASLAACGGGGGASGDSPFGGPGGTGGTGTGTGGVDVAAPNVALTLSAGTVTAAAPAIVTAKVTESTGASVAGQVVSFAFVSGLGAANPATALTDSSGVATTTLSPAAGATSGADTIQASVTVNGKTTVASKGFQLTATNVSIASFTSDLATIDAYGQTELTVALAGATAGTPVKVTLTSSCVNKARATLTPATVTTTTGTASFTYRDGGCGAFDAIDGVQASVEGTAATASLQLGLTSALAASVAFVGADPSAIYLRGSGFVENSNVTFQVRDTNGQGVPNQEVRLEPTTLAGGLLIDGGSIAVVKRTDAEGKVLARINSGTVPTPVRIKATLVATPTIATVSSNLAIAVGLPSQLNFSLSQTTINIEGYNYDGVENAYMIIASDRLGNPVPADTAINFVSESGQIQAIKYTDATGGLSKAVANFLTSEPRPVDGRITVLAYSLGEKSFLDVNGNNVYDTGEDYQDLGDVFLDRLANGSYNAADDQYISLSIGGSSSCVTASSPLLASSLSIPSRSLSNTGAPIASCTPGWGRAYVRRQIETILSTSGSRPLYGTSLPLNSYVPAGVSCPAPIALRNGYSSTDAAATANYYVFGTIGRYSMPKGGTISLLAADANPVAANPMPAGTKVTASPSDGMSAEIFGSPIPSTSSPSGVTVRYQFSDGVFSGTVTVIFTTPRGVVTSASQYVSMDPAPGTYISCP